MFLPFPVKSSLPLDSILSSFGLSCPAGRLYYSAAALTLRLAGAWRLTRQSRGVPRPAAPLGWGPRPFPRSPLRDGREACHSATLRVRLPVHRSPRPLSPLRYAPGAFRPGYGESGRGQARVLFYRLRAAFRTASASFRNPTNCAMFPLVTHRSSDTYISHPPSI